MGRYTDNPQAVAALVRGREVHRDVYIDPEVYRLEMKHLFANAWVFVGHDSQTPNKGDYFTTQIGDQPVIMVRHTDNEIKVLYNRCPHKGTKIAIDRTGNTGKFFRCPYHAWSFKTDGCLLAIPLKKGYEGTGLEDQQTGKGMKAVGAVQNYRGFVFARLAEEGLSFEEFFGDSLSSLARLDTMVSVVDASTFLDRFDVLEELADLGVGRDDDDDRSVTDLLVDQIEFADVLVVSKPDLVTPERLERTVAVVRQLNPRARVIVAERGDVPLDEILDTGLFDADEAATAPGWVTALNDEPTPETEEYGITSFVYRHRWPFHPQRLGDELGAAWPGVLRSKGFLWLATRPDVQALWSQAGLSVMLEPLALWYGATPQEEWEFESDEERADLDARWEPIVGDRQTELVFIGIDMDEADIRARLDRCVVTGKEFEKGPQKWARFRDPLPEWDLSCDL